MSILLGVMQSEIPNLTEENLHRSFGELGVDSFSIVSIRAAVEATIGNEISDESWVKVRSPQDILAFHQHVWSNGQVSSGAHCKREFLVGMPQMANSGLSEGWLHREMGDMHWTMLCDGLRTSSSQIADSEGNRLYATFVRLAYTASAPLSAFKENERLTIEASLVRYGGGQFVSHFEGRSGDIDFKASMVSSFSRRAEKAGNSLLRAQPHISPDCEIPNSTTKPEEISTYQEVRSTVTARISAADQRYRINPYVDLNGVGLLYFAAYPLISDYCWYLQSSNSEAARSRTTVSREISYFANTDPDGVIDYHEVSSNGDEQTCLLSKEDGTPMALVRTHRA